MSSHPRVSMEEARNRYTWPLSGETLFVSRDDTQAIEVIEQAVDRAERVAGILNQITEAGTEIGYKT